MKAMKIVIALTTVLLLMPALAQAGSTSCTTRKSGSVVIETCSGDGGFVQCRSYWSDKVKKTYCRR